MKKLIVLIILLNCEFVSAQIDNTFGTWYLVYVEPDTGEPPATYVDPIEPAINPYLTINEDLSFTGYAACNSFTGQFKFHPDNWLELVDFNRTSDNCGIEVHQDFENLLFNLYWNPWPDAYEYIVHGSGSSEELSLTFAFGFVQYYQRLPLSVNENEAAKVKLYPNPTTNSFQLTGNLSDNTRLTVTGINGMQFNLPYNAQESVDVSGLSSGIYILTITDQKQRQQLKLVKL